MDEEGAYAARMDEWVVWETVEGEALGARTNLSSFFLFPFVDFLSRLSFISTPRPAHSALQRAEDLLVL
jgi:hypothetical protein